MDLWSSGCILAEIIVTQDIYKSQSDITVNRKPIFVGRYCGGLSPAKENHPPKMDQLEVILRFLGNQDESDLCFITEPENEEYVKLSQPKMPKRDFLKKYPLTNPDIIAIL